MEFDRLTDYERGEYDAMAHCRVPSGRLGSRCASTAMAMHMRKSK